MTPSPRHAYLIMAHGDLPMLEALVSCLDDERNDLYIHIDNKWQGFSPRGLRCHRAGLVVLPQRLDVRWGHTSLMEAELLLMQAAYQSGHPYSYYHIRSGVDLPLVSQDELHEFFARHQGHEFVPMWEFDSAMNDAAYKAERYHLWTRYERNHWPRWCDLLVARLRRYSSNALSSLLPQRNTDIRLVKGANWVSITHALVGAIVERREELRRRYRLTRNCDEIFVATFVANSPFASAVYRHSDGTSYDPTYVEWTPHTPSPDTLTMASLERMLSSGALFARKFSSAVDMDVVRALQAHLKGSEPITSER